MPCDGARSGGRHGGDGHDDGGGARGGLIKVVSVRIIIHFNESTKHHHLKVTNKLTNCNQKRSIFRVHSHCKPPNEVRVTVKKTPVTYRSSGVRSAARSGGRDGGRHRDRSAREGDRSSLEYGR